MKTIQNRKEIDMKYFHHENEATSDKKPLTKENTMKADTYKKKDAGRYVIFTFIAAGVLIMTSALIAQPLMAGSKGRNGPAMSPDEIVQTLTARLGLSEEQAEAVRPIVEEKSLLMKKIRDKKELNRKESRSAMHRLMLDADMRLGRILTDEQLDTYIDLKQERRKQMHRDKSGDKKMRGQFSKTADRKINRLNAILDLTEGQTVKVEPIIKKSMEKREEVFGKYKDRKQQMQQAMRNEMQTIDDEIHEQLSKILTVDQMKKLTSIEEKRRAKMGKHGERHGHMKF